MTGVIYARYSEGPKQTDQSIEGQVADCKAYAEQNGIDIVEIYADRHISGKSLAGRDEFQRMLYDAEHHKFDCVIVWKIDRFGRNRQDIAISKMKLKKAGVELHYAAEAVPEGAEGIILESLLEGLAEYYSADLRQKVTRGIRESAKKGRYCGASVPIGYTTDADRHVIIDEKAAEAVREAFQMHIAGATTKDIIEMFNQRGIRSSRGKEITPAVVYRMLRNERYTGAWELAGVALDVPGIISEETFIEASKHFKTSRNNAANTAKTDYLLSCKCYCGYCGALVRGESGTGRNGKLYNYYKCGASKKKGHKCELRPIKKELLEEIIIQAISDHMLTKKTIDALVVKIMELQREDQEHDLLTSLQNRLKDAEKRQAKLLKAIEYGGELEIVMDRLKEIDAEIKGLKSQIATEKIQRPIIPEDRIRAWLESFQNGDLTDDNFRARLVETFVHHIELKNEEALIFFNTSDKPNSGRNTLDSVSTTIRQVDLNSLWSKQCPPNQALLFVHDFIILRLTIPQISEPDLDTLEPTIGNVRKWVRFEHGIKVSKSSVCSVRDKCGCKDLSRGSARIIPQLKSRKELAILDAFKAMGILPSQIESPTRKEKEC